MKRKIWTAAGAVLLALYWFLVVDITGGTPTNFIITGDFSRTADLSLIPFHDILDILASNNTAGSFLQIAGNILLFAPLGFLTPLFWAGWRSAGRAIGLGAAMSLFIEINQLFTYRATSVDDLLLNTLGAVLGFVCWLAARHLFHLPDRVNRRLEKMPVLVMLAAWGAYIVKELPMYLMW